ncbi:gnat family protein [Fusarium heterosporum]|uniref:Gnat family protein n=1 Tax=Fusarium heterosporum TaxID=42747 RepID=A0A8H5T3Y8_FUSHE|nr:gnat family protein [Fusarium heterosporum]
MADFVKVYTTIPPALLTLLANQLPYSLPLLRRLQFAKFEGGLCKTARVVLVADSQFDGPETLPQKFTAAYVDVGGGPGTQAWIYSTLEHPDQADVGITIYENQFDEMVKQFTGIARDYGRELVYGDSVLLGTLHDSVRELMHKTGRIVPRETGAYDKWLFKYEDLPKDEVALPEGMHWGTATEDDCRLVVSRTNIPRTVEVLGRMPSLVIKLDDGTPVSWAFLGFDGSLLSLHCEEPYRRRGLAKTLAAKLFREKSREFADDGWCAADVAPDNDGSRGMCKRLNGKPYWRISWVLLRVGENVPGQTNSAKDA